MPLKVIQWATGGVGRESLRHIISDPSLELVGVYVYSDEKNGLDAGELCDLPTTGVKATNNRDEMLSLDADCVMYCPLIYTDRPMHDENDADIIDLLNSGKNVVTVNGYIWPSIRGEEVGARLEAACKKGNATLYGTGLNPGYLMGHMVPAVTSLCQRIDHLKVRENWDATDFIGPELLFEMVGFAKPEGWLTKDSPAGVMLAAWFNEGLMGVAHTLGKKLDRFEREFEYGLATRDITIKAGEIPKGTIAAVGWTWTGFVGDKPFVSFTDRWIADWDIPGWSGPKKHHWTVEVQGAPSVTVGFDFEDTYPPISDKYDASDRVMVAVTASAAVNAIPDVCEAPAGIHKGAPLSPCRVFK